MSYLATHGIQHHRNILLLLKSCNNRMSEELKTAEKEHQEIKGSIGVEDAIVHKLEEIDSLKVELQKFRMVNAQMNVMVTSLSAKIGGLQEEVLDLRKVREGVQKEHSEIMKKRSAVVRLRSKVLPKAELRELKAKLAEDSVGLKNISEELNWLKNETPLLVRKRDSLKEELEQTVKRIPSAQEHITSLKDQIERLSPKVTSEDEVKRLEEEVRALKPRKERLTQENREISPRIASIKEEEEKITSILEAYKSKNQSEKDRISEFEKEIKEMDIDADTVVKLRENVSSIEEELGPKTKDIERLKKEYSELLDSNQRYKATIKEVDEGTERLKKMMDK